jgi:hypothetical protein
VSAGVSVAYFSSIALLAVAATQKPKVGDDWSPTNHFDTVVFLTTFLLAGKYRAPGFLSADADY